MHGDAAVSYCLTMRGGACAFYIEFVASYKAEVGILIWWHKLYDARTEVCNTYDRLQCAFSLVREATYA